MNKAWFMAQMARKRPLTLTLTLFLLLVGVPFAAAQAPDRNVIDAAARAFTERTNAPGLAIGVVTRAGARVYSYGVASMETGAPVDERTLFEIGSISKTFTVALASYAAETGALQWSDPPSRYVPELKGTPLDHVTLLNLATHTTGGMPLQLPDGVMSNADLMAYFRAWKPPSQPGSVRTYANPSIGLLGVVTARALKGNFATLMREHITAPLGLQQTFHEVPQDEQRHYAQGYTRDGKPVRLSAAPLATEAYGIRTTARDLLRFVEAQFETVGSNASLRSALIATHVGYFRAGPMTQALIWEWYLPTHTAGDIIIGNSETMVLKANPVTPLEPPQPPPADGLVNKTGATNGFGAYVAFIPGRKIGLVVLANRNHPTAVRLMLAEQVFAALGVQSIPNQP